jgi:trimeric autotransporter adhesin
MKVAQGLGLLLFLISRLSLCGFAQSGIITTYAGPSLHVNGTPALTQVLDHPDALALDGTGGLYVSIGPQNRIYRITATGLISLTAGFGFSGFSGDGGLATAAKLNNPHGVAVDPAGNLYIADASNNRIRKVTPRGIISTVAGNGSKGFSGNGSQATAAQLNEPIGVAVDSAGNLYIADNQNHRIRKVTTTGIINTVAGNGTKGFRGDGGPATAAQLNYPWGVAVDSAGNLYFTEFGNHRIRKVTTAGIISTVGGNGTRGFSGDGGPATAAQFDYPLGLAVDSAGNIYLADLQNHRIRKVTNTGIISTVAGNGTKGFSGDGGPATTAQLNYPYGVAVNSAGSLFIADTENNRIRVVTRGP